ncbi:hypothetical protein K501DRAFT_267839 [Backusella circina FSU 941]|nr:hypothetical protein K501DRAFT_267839 [Backusella circina FSU 941]
MVPLIVLLFFTLAGVSAYEFRVTFLKPLHYNHIDVTVAYHGCRYTMSSANIIGVNNGTFVSTSCNSRLYPNVSVYSSPRYVIRYLITSIGDKYDCRLIQQNVGKVHYICSLSGTRETKSVTTTTTIRVTKTRVISTIITTTKTKTINATKTVAAFAIPRNSGNNKLKKGVRYNEYYCLAKSGCNGPTQAISASINYPTGVFRQR